MEKERSMQALLKIMLANKDLFNAWPCSGLCSLVDRLLEREIITHSERCKLHNYIKVHRPKRGIHYQKHIIYSWYWPLHQWKPREAWLKSKIRKS
ncbi:MAG: hypothetical protein M0R17_08035 [Candidatus Omnitrophica bacterium]|jgi:hypothetical protein|nr:hypothetical protein [Candidatus Omnitrophota bacterium]